MKSIFSRFFVRLTLLFVGCLAAGILPITAFAYVESGYHWPSGQPIVLNPRLGAPYYPLLDGSKSWDQVAEEAMSIWNVNLGSGVQLQPRYQEITPAQADGINSVFFSNTVYGEDFGSDTLAITISYFNHGTPIVRESDVIFNSNYSFNSYRGALKIQGLRVSPYDFRRIAIHEFGHLLGLDHVPQSSASIMAPAITDIDTVQADDIAGITAIYGPPGPVIPFISSALRSSAALGRPFSYQITATNFPTGFAANGLPEGLSINASTGLITGTPAITGTYQITLFARGNGGAGTGVLTLVVTAVPAITSSLSATAYLGYPFHYQITASGKPTSFKAIGQQPQLNGNLPLGLTFDPATGVISGTPTAVGGFIIGLVATNAVADGTAFLKLNIASDATVRVLYKFERGGPIGIIPSSLILSNDGNLYGTTRTDGSNNGGVFFKVSPDETVSTIYSFSRPGPYSPISLRQAADGSFYGTTTSGGANNLGAIFKITADGTLTTLYSFSRDLGGTTPYAKVIQATDGNYYGALNYNVYYTATELAGIFFKLTPDGVMTILHRFNVSDGFNPSALIQATDGNFYGTTNGGGSSADQGTVFKITPDGALTTLHRFTSKEGAYPLAPLIQATDGNFYGTTDQGGNYDSGGTVFKITPNGVLTTIHAFNNSEGKNPTAALAQGADGNFYGTTGLQGVPGAGVFAGTIFKVTPDGALTNIHVFSYFDGTAPFLPLVPDKDGNFYGASADISSVLFKVTPTAVPAALSPPLTVTDDGPLVTDSDVPTVTLAATTPEVTVGSGEMGMFTATLSAQQTTDVMIHYTIKGTAFNGTDYTLLNGFKKIKAGKTSKPIKIIPQGDLGGAAKKTVVLVLEPGDGYAVGTAEKVKVKLLAKP